MQTTEVEVMRTRSFTRVNHRINDRHGCPLNSFLSNFGIEAIIEIALSSGENSEIDVFKKELTENRLKVQHFGKKTQENCKHLLTAFWDAFLYLRSVKYCCMTGFVQSRTSFF